MSDKPCSISWTRLTDSGVVSHKPCLFFGMIITEAGAGALSATIYDGDNTSGHQFIRLEVAAASTKDLLLPYPVIFNYGIYVEFESGLDEATVLWKPL